MEWRFKKKTPAELARLLARDETVTPYWREAEETAMAQGIPPNILSQGLLGMVPGMGVAGALGYGPTYSNPFDFVPTGFAKTGSNLFENVDQGNYGQALLQGIGVVPDAGFALLGAKALKPAARGALLGDYAGAVGERGGVGAKLLGSAPPADRPSLGLLDPLRSREATPGSQTKPAGAGEMSDNYIYHTSPEKIVAIHDRGMFGDVLHFSTKPYTMSAAENSTTYKMKYSDDDFIDASSLYHHDDAAKIQPIANRLAKRYGITSDAAEDIISGNKSSYDFGLDSETSAQLGWDAQTAAAQSAKKLGYKGARGQDEQGSVYMVPMSGREKELLLSAGASGRNAP